MNTAGNRNIDEPISFGQKSVLSLIRLLLPPHVDKGGLSRTRPGLLLELRNDVHQ